MRFFLRSKQFKLLVIIVLSIIVLSVGAKIIGSAVSVQSNILGSIAAPFQKAAAHVSNFFGSISERFGENTQIIEENEQLKQQVNDLTSKLLNYTEAIEENKFYEDYLEIKEQHSDFQFEPAMVISRDFSDSGYSFTINKGTLNGVKAYDPVITHEGLVGYISQVGLNYAKVSTVLSADINVAAFDRRTHDVGIVSGNLDLSKEYKTRLYNLPRSCTVTLGDYIVTSGGGVFPEGLLIGTVTEIDQEKYSSSLYAVVDPAADLENLNELMVITYFEGKSQLAESAGNANE